MNLAYTQGCGVTHLPSSDTVTEEDAGVGLSHDHTGTSGTQGDRGMLRKARKQKYTHNAQLSSSSTWLY